MTTQHHEDETVVEVKELFSNFINLLPLQSRQYNLYLYHLRQLALILDGIENGEDLTSTLRYLNKIGAELPLS